MMAVIFSAALSVHAQRTITGTIVDQATNEPLIQAYLARGLLYGPQESAKMLKDLKIGIVKWSQNIRL